MRETVSFRINYFTYSYDEPGNLLSFPNKGLFSLQITLWSRILYRKQRSVVIADKLCFLDLSSI